jgi:hypothetical protein
MMVASANQRGREAAFVVAMVAATLLLPPLVYAAAVYRKFAALDLSSYIPHEELVAALRSASPGAIFAAPLLSVDLTSKMMVASMFTLTLGQFLVSVSLGTLLGLNAAARLGLLSSCPARNLSGLAAATTSGLASTVAATSTGLLGCCGPALSGGVLALLGLSATTAQAIAKGSPFVEGALLLIFGLDYLRLRRHLGLRDHEAPVSSTTVRADGGSA